VCTSYECYSYFVFQAEDGIRDFHVTGVQTCALPIFHLENLSAVKKLRKVPRICADNVNSCEPERIRSGARCAHPTGGDSFFLAAKPPFAAASLNADPAISRGAGHDVILSALVNPPLDGAAARCPAFRAFPGPRALF